MPIDGNSTRQKKRVFKILWHTYIQNIENQLVN